jgi:hypothetical protein
MILFWYIARDTILGNLWIQHLRKEWDALAAIKARLRFQDLVWDVQMFTTWLMTMLSAVITIFSEYLVLISRMLAKMFSNRTYREWTIGIHLS